MSLKELEESVAHLPPDELAKFRDWFLEFDALQFDKRIEDDAQQGRLDGLAENALRDHTAGRSRSL